MSGSITRALAAWLAAGETRIGELTITGQYELRHHLDADAQTLTPYTAPEAARDISRYDAAGVYRPLKTAPNLKRGWRLTLGTIEELHEALDGFYPAMLAARLAYQQGRLAVTPLRDTLNRQSGMYAVTKRITNPQADTMIGALCGSEGCAPGCLKTILWPIAPDIPITTLPPEKFDPVSSRERQSPDWHSPLPIPLLCAEACNLLVARAREVVKQQPN